MFNILIINSHQPPVYTPRDPREAPDKQSRPTSCSSPAAAQPGPEESEEANSKRQTAQSEEREAAQGALDTNLLSSSETGTPCENPGLTRAKTRVAAAAHQDPLGVSRRLLILSLIPAKNCFFSSLFSSSSHFSVLSLWGEYSQNV